MLGMPLISRQWVDPDLAPRRVVEVASIVRQPLLALLAKEPAHGYELKLALEQTFGAAYPSPNIGQIYVTLKRLEADVLAREIDASGRIPHDRADVDGIARARLLGLEVDVGATTTTGEPGTASYDSRRRGLAFDRYGWRALPE